MRTIPRQSLLCCGLYCGQANELAEQMERDADGYLIYKGDMNQAAVEAMQQVGTDYGRLQGYYPQPNVNLFFGAAPVRPI